jgi:hypothetical protein
MVYFVSSSTSIYDGVYASFLDDPREEPFDYVGYEADPATLDLKASEREKLRKGNSAISNGYRVNGAAAPKKVLYACGNRPLPEAIMASVPLYSQRLRDLIESFEPGVHQFFPVDIYKTKNGEPVATYYWFNVCNRIDSVNEEKTNFTWTLDYTGNHGFWDKDGVENPKMVFSTEKTKNYTFWIDPNLLIKDIFCSNAFAEAALSEGFLGLNFSEKEEG